MFELTNWKNRNNNTLFNPFQEWENFERDFFKNNSLSEFKTDIRDNGKEYTIEADLPGFKKEDIKVDVDGNYLTISAERHTENEHKDEKGNFIKRERSYGSFSRSFDISSVKSDSISAEYKDGVLKLVLPKKESTVPSSRRLEIK